MIFYEGLGVIYYFLGLEVYQGDHGILIIQKVYILDIIKKFNMLNCNTTAPINP